MKGNPMRQRLVRRTTATKARGLAHRGAVLMSLLCSATVLSTLGATPKVALAALPTDIVGPAGSGAFGEQVLIQTNGNFVVVDSKFDSAGLTDVGAVALYNGTTNQMISRLTGAAAGDAVGSGGVVEVGNSNFVVASRSVNAGAGARPGPAARSA